MSHHQTGIDGVQEQSSSPNEYPSVRMIAIDFFRTNLLLPLDAETRAFDPSALPGTIA